MKYWLLWEVSIPLLIMGSFWPVRRYIVGSPHAFEEAFCNGDLFLFASLLLLGVAIDVKLSERTWKAQGMEGDLSFTREVSRALAFLSILGYGAVRYHQMFSEEVIDLSIRNAYALAGWSIVLLAVGQGVYALAKAAQFRQEKEIL